jgi:SAM-dependent methyltransferase
MGLLVPEELNRNADVVRIAGPENTACAILALVAERLNLTTFADSDILDVGCGVRFTQAIINRQISIGSYTGVDIHKPLIDFLQSEITDPRFAFAWWNVHNDQYNVVGVPMQSYEHIPVKGKFDIICLFSVFTHLFPDDTRKLLEILRRHAQENTALVFTAFIVDDIEVFENRSSLPEIYGCYGEDYMRSIIASTGWRVDNMDPPDPDCYVQNLFVCRPK